MKITLQRTNQAVKFIGKNAAGNQVEVEGSPEIGGTGEAMRPMEMLLVSLASCSSMDVVSILKKKRQPLDDLRVEVEAERASDRVPAVFTKIHLRFFLKGAGLQAKSVEQAIQLAVEKYCSVGEMLRRSAAISWSFAIN
jgi:putative redox protein